MLLQHAQKELWHPKKHWDKKERGVSNKMRNLELGVDPRRKT